MTLTLTGAQLEALLEQQFHPAGTSILQVSRGFAFTWKASGPPGDKVDPASITLNGTPLDPKASYRVTVNNFMASGGDSFTVLTQGKEPLTGVMDLDALDAYTRANNPLTVPEPGRITRLP